MNDGKSRTWLLKGLVIGYLVVAWFGWMRLYAVISSWNLYIDYLSSPMLIYIGAGGVVWGMAGLIAALSLWFGMPFASWFSRSVSMGCFVWFWLDYLFLAQSALSRTNFPFALVVSLLALTCAWLFPALPKERIFLQHRITRGP